MHRHAGTCWQCWYCTSIFLTQTTRMHHMSRWHPLRSRLAPPRRFVELHHRAEVARPVASGLSPAPVVALSTTQTPVDEPESVGATEAAHPVVGGLCVVRVPVDR